jgi:hypothetical protein
MTGFTRVDKKSRRTGAGEAGSHFARYMAGFAHAHDDNFSGAAEHQVTGTSEFIIDIFLQPAQGCDLGFQHPETHLPVIERFGHYSDSTTTYWPII